MALETTEDSEQLPEDVSEFDVPDHDPAAVEETRERLVDELAEFREAV